MGSVAQAVVEFDEEVRAPWRPRLVVTAGADDAASTRAPVSRPSRRSPSRVGVRRPHVPSPSRGAAAPRPEFRLPARGVGAPRRVAAGRRPAVTAVPTAGVRLTRRARRLAIVLALAAGVAVGCWVGPLLGGGPDGLRLAGGGSVVVQPGDTLWSIASSLDGDGDVRVVVDQIQALNGLRDGGLVPGQRLVLP